MGGHEKYKELVTYLSRNDTRSVYKETDEEQVVLKLREVLHARQEDARTVMADPTSCGKLGSYSSVDLPGIWP